MLAPLSAQNNFSKDLEGEVLLSDHVLCLNRSNTANNATASSAFASADPISWRQLHCRGNPTSKRATAKYTPSCTT